MSMTILGASTKTYPAFGGFPGLPGTEMPARIALVWRVAVVNFGRYRDGVARVMEFEATTREELREKVADASREDLAGYRVGD